MPRLLLASLLMLIAQPACAAIISERPEAVAVTIYHEGTVDTEYLMENNPDHRNYGLAMIHEVRTVDLPEGNSEIQFRGVAATMVAETAELSGLPEGTLQRNFDYDLLSPSALVNKSQGQSVLLIRTDKRTGVVTQERALVMAGAQGAILKIGDRYEALGCNVGAERLVFDRLPENLVDRPTLTVKVQAVRAGRYTVALRYVATGMNWAAAYVAHIRPDGRTLDLAGWLTLANFGETGFPAASVDVIAGHVETTGEDAPKNAEVPAISPQCWPMHPDFATYPRPLDRLRRAVSGFNAPTPITNVEAEQVTVSSSRLEARDVGDYKQYVLPVATDVAAQQTKQVQFLDQSALPFERFYRGGANPTEYSPDNIQPATIILKLSNTERGGLGKPLPAGEIATMGMAADGLPLLVGMGRVDDVPAGAPVEIPAGESTDVWAQAKEVERNQVKTGEQERTHSTVEVTLTNSRPTPVSFEWHQGVYEDTRVKSETRKHIDKDGDLCWIVTLGPTERIAIRYTLDMPDN